ncbi:YdbH domain-containing protein [Erythrobacter sp. THAF29]|uniref:intermembrane phospholipid transport protein YdbH family protein n=1 Tax=Erythrobacter sp. THAF29 TaxID=2587851 RepID=UPI001268002C|nr:YdbH domain-containing protein [Erythrobacter sp. THAF29]QFT78166.1 Dicarboxylate transport [Erythrobacter sp. THAF29]
MVATEQYVLENDDAPGRSGLWPSRWRWRISLGMLLVILAVLIGAWFSREQIAGLVIEDLLEQYDLEASYDIVSIDPQRQVIANLVIGDPDRPNFTAEQVTVNLDYGFRSPSVEGVSLVKPRLYGTYLEGELSFGSLDPLIFTDSDGPAALPEMDVFIEDGRALIESDYGAIAAKLNGRGPLDDGFAGELALTAPGIGNETCSAREATAYGDLATSAGSLSFDGPLRLRKLECEGARVASAYIGASLAVSKDFTVVDGDLDLRGQRIAYSGNSLAQLAGEVEFGWSERGLNLDHNLTGETLATAYATIGRIAADGSFRADPSFERSEWRVGLSGEDLNMASDASAPLASARDASEGTFLAPLLAKFDRSLAQALSGGRLEADAMVRTGDAGLRVLLPEARVAGANDDMILALSRVAWANVEQGTRITGNFITGGEGLPQITGRMEQSPGGSFALRATMEEYAVGADRIAIPRMQVRKDRSGSLNFVGLVRASGALPGGSVRDLDIPLEGAWGDNGLVIGQRCSEMRFESLAIAQLSLRAQRLALCPQSGGSMVRYDDALRIKIETRSLTLAGELADSPASLSAGAASINYPGGFKLEEFSATIGTGGSAVRLTAAQLDGTFDEAVGGTFTGGTAQLDLVPLDLAEMAGNWAYVGDTVVVEEGAFVLTERLDGVEVTEARFEPLIANDATLTLSGETISAKADLLNPGSMRLVTRVDVIHDLATGNGRAGIDFPGLLFDEKLAPEDVSILAKGVIAFANGTISGRGEVLWTDGDVDSKGTFSTDGLDLAATFGPIDGLRGSIAFTDLINLTTAPGQVLEIAALNPGIEVLEGRVEYSMTGGELIAVEDARWPFMGGTLILRPVKIEYGSPGPQRYVFEMVGLDAEVFVAQMELSNIGASGIFDGTVPIVFDSEGNGTIEGGLLISRPPGGNVSYVGELTYEDMGAMANFAFQSLRSLDYNQMMVGLDGSLAGEIITNFRIDGVRQGEGASRNFVTRQLAKLPIRFNISVRSHNFYELSTVVRSYFDPSYLSNPTTRGFRFEDGRLVPISPFAEPQLPDNPDDGSSNPEEIRRDDEPAVQPPESDNLQ